MFLIFRLLELAPLEFLGAIFYLSYNYPNSIFRYLLVRFGRILGFILIVIQFAFFWKDMQHFIPYGIPVNSSDGVISFVEYVSPIDSPSNGRNDINGRSYGYDISFYVKNNTRYDVTDVVVDVEMYECENKPEFTSGPSAPSGCVYNEKEDSFDLSNHIFKDKSLSKIVTKTYINGTNLSSGKYPYVFFKTDTSAKLYRKHRDERPEYMK